MSGPYRRSTAPVLDSTAATYVPAPDEHLDPNSATTRYVNRLSMRAHEGSVVRFDTGSHHAQVSFLYSGSELVGEPASLGLRASMARQLRRMAGLEGAPPISGIVRLAWAVEHPSPGTLEVDLTAHVRAASGAERVLLAHRASRPMATLGRTDRESLGIVRGLLERAVSLQDSGEASALAERARAGARLLDGDTARPLHVDAELLIAHLAHTAGDSASADEACRRAVEVAGEETTLGFAALHRRAVYSAERLASDASERAAELCAFARARLGEAHPDTLYAESARVSVLRDLGRAQEARATWLTVRDAFIAVFGEDDDELVELDAE